MLCKSINSTFLFFVECGDLGLYSATDQPICTPNEHVFAKQMLSANWAHGISWFITYHNFLTKGHFCMPLSRRVACVPAINVNQFWGPVCKMHFVMEIRVETLASWNTNIQLTLTRWNMNLTVCLMKPLLSISIHTTYIYVCIYIYISLYNCMTSTLVP